LATYNIFETIKNVLDKNPDIGESDVTKGNAARRLIVKFVNGLTSLQETGGPAVCASLLGYPDHYMNQTFKVFYWLSYVQYISHQEKVKVDNTDSEKVLLQLTKDGVTPASKVNDYIFRPVFFEQMPLYEYLHTADICCNPSSTAAKNIGNNESSDGESFDAETFVQGHPSRRTHGVKKVHSGQKYILDFRGACLSRPDVGNRKEYCKTMLVLFAPKGWRQLLDLKGEHTLWDAAFNSTVFHEWHYQIMRNMNVLYECLDVRDDYAA
ncbi:hypothetical protein OBBRIDRAFT_694752, partial [Obba rivulosa]